MITNGAGESQSGVEEVKQELSQASEDWTKYVKASEEPSPGVAIQVSPALFQLAEISSSSTAAVENVKAATEAQEIVADARPSLNSLSTLAFYQLFDQNYKAAKEVDRQSDRTRRRHQVRTRTDRKQVRRSRKKREKIRQAT